MQDFQDAVRRFQDEHGLRLPPELAALDLVSEVGELAKEVLLSTSYGTKARTPTSNLEAELGDVCYSLASLANSLGLDVWQALAKRLAVYQTRFVGRESAKE